MAFLKRLFRDLGDLDKGEFFIKYIFPLIAFLLLLTGFHRLSFLWIEESDLTKHNGRIINAHFSTERESFRGTVYKNNYLNITLDNGYFIKMDEDDYKDYLFKPDSFEPMGNFTEGNHLAIYTLGETSQVYKIERNGEQLYGIEKKRKDIKTELWYLFGIPPVIFGIRYLLKKYPLNAPFKSKKEIRKQKTRERRAMRKLIKTKNK